MASLKSAFPFLLHHLDDLLLPKYVLLWSPSYHTVFLLIYHSQYFLSSSSPFLSYTPEYECAPRFYPSLTFLLPLSVPFATNLEIKCNPNITYVYCPILNSSSTWPKHNFHFPLLIKTPSLAILIVSTIFQALTLRCLLSYGWGNISPSLILVSTNSHIYWISSESLVVPSFFALLLLLY